MLLKKVWLLRACDTNLANQKSREFWARQTELENMSDSSEVDLSEFSEDNESSSCSWSNESSDSNIDEIVRKKSIGKTIQKASKRKKMTPQRQAVKALSSSTNKMTKKSLFACTSTSKSVQRDLPQLDDSTEASMSPTSVTGSSTSGLPTITATLISRILSTAPATSVHSPTTSVLSPSTSLHNFTWLLNFSFMQHFGDMFASQ